MDKIIPWGSNDLTNDLFIPDYINQYANEVLKHYDFSVKSMTVAATKPLKGAAIWKLETNTGPKSLKFLHREPSRSLFSIGAQEYLVSIKKANVPPIYKTKEGESSVEMGGKLWFVAEWIEPLTPASKDLEGAKQLCSALGNFHSLSKGYIPPVQAEIASRIHKWPKKYEKMLVKLDWFRQIALAYNEMPASAPLLSVIDLFEDQAKQSLQRLEESRYSTLIQKDQTGWGLVHQDYGWSNAQMGENGIWIIDLDGVAFDLPIRDLRKLIDGTMYQLSYWDATWVREMIRAYSEEHPISPELYEILMIDFSLPNEFYKGLKDIVYEPDVFLNEETAQEIEKIVRLEDTKWSVLEEIKDDWKGAAHQ